MIMGCCTMKKYLLIGAIIVIALIGLNQAGITTTGLIVGSNNSTIKADKIEVYHFHGTHQCYSCIRLGQLAQLTINEYFKEELDKGIVVFAHVNMDLSENQELVTKYGATGSSLWIGTYIGNKFHKEQNINVWYKINNEMDYKEYLSGLITKRLNGDLN